MSAHLPNLGADSIMTKSNVLPGIAKSENRFSMKVYLEPEIEDKRKKELRSGLLKSMGALRQSEQDSIKQGLQAEETSVKDKKQLPPKSIF